LVTLYKVLGGGWEVEANDAASVADAKPSPQPAPAQ
jgi:hypothetical protein